MSYELDENEAIIEKKLDSINIKLEELHMPKHLFLDTVCAIIVVILAIGISTVMLLSKIG